MIHDNRLLPCGLLTGWGSAADIARRAMAKYTMLKKHGNAVDFVTVDQVSIFSSSTVQTENKAQALQSRRLLVHLTGSVTRLMRHIDKASHETEITSHIA